MQQFQFISLLLLFPFFLMAQPEPCIDPPTMTSFCADACIICDIDGFTGRHDANIVGEAPPRFDGECTRTAHNMQWIAFIAGSEDLEFRMSVSNCRDGRGLEFGLYRGINCDNFKRISNCFGAGNQMVIPPGSSGVIRNNEPLEIGQYYYIVMDGALEDNCDWTFDVLLGTTQVAPLETSGTIEGAFTTCRNLEQIYHANPPIGATEFKWQLDGQELATNAPELPLIFDQVGIFIWLAEIDFIDGESLVYFGDVALIR